MAVLYPASLPAWLAAGHSLEQADCYAAPVRRAVGLPRRRRVFRSAPQAVSASLLLTADQMATFAAWYEDDLQAGSLAFQTRVMGLGTTLSTHDAVFASPYRYTPQPTARGVMYRVEASLRLVGASVSYVPPEDWSGINYLSNVGGDTSVLMLGVSWISIPTYTGFVAVGRSQYLLSTDGSNWSAGQPWVGPLSFLYVYDIQSNGTHYIANSGAAAWVGTSLSGSAAQITGSGAPTGFPVRVKWVHDRWVWCSGNGTLWTAASALGPWTLRATMPSGSSQSIRDVARLDNGRWCAVGFGGACAVSDDGDNWTAVTPTGLASPDARVVRTDGTRFTLAQNSRIAVSTNGVSWTTILDTTTPGQYYTGWFNGLEDMVRAGPYWVVCGTPADAAGICWTDDEWATVHRVVFTAPAGTTNLTSLAVGNDHVVGLASTRQQLWWASLLAS